MPVGHWFFQFSLRLAASNGRSLARRLTAEGKRYPPEQLDKVLRERLAPLGAGMNPQAQAQERLTAEAVAAAKEWLQQHGVRRC